MIKEEDVVMIKVCILDLDGTLLDTVDSLLFSVNKTMNALSLPEITWHQCRDFVGNGARSLLEKAILSSSEVCEEAVLEEAVLVFAPIFAENCMYKVEPYEGIREVLQCMKEKGIRLAILSNKPHARTVEIVETFFGKGYFEVVQGQEEGVPRKPDPQSIYYVIEKLGAKKEECSYVGDSEVDMETGNRASIATIGVSWGFRDRSILEAGDPMAIIDSPEQLIEIIENNN